MDGSSRSRILSYRCSVLRSVRGRNIAWICRSSALPGPVLCEDQYTITDGKITRLEVRIVEAGN
ncbi:MAG: hypothetical protein GY788_11315 [bacterium]|nr:hypothetical protein [bacterium]